MLFYQEKSLWNGDISSINLHIFINYFEGRKSVRQHGHTSKTRDMMRSR